MNSRLVKQKKKSFKQVVKFNNNNNNDKVKFIKKLMKFIEKWIKFLKKKSPHTHTVSLTFYIDLLICDNP